MSGKYEMHNQGGIEKEVGSSSCGKAICSTLATSIGMMNACQAHRPMPSVVPLSSRDSRSGRDQAYYHRPHTVIITGTRSQGRGPLVAALDTSFWLFVVELIAFEVDD